MSELISEFDEDESGELSTDEVKAMMTALNKKQPIKEEDFKFVMRYPAHRPGRRGPTDGWCGGGQSGGQGRQRHTDEGRVGASPQDVEVHVHEMSNVERSKLNIEDTPVCSMRVKATKQS